jgi:hypothetical protein
MQHSRWYTVESTFLDFVSVVVPSCSDVEWCQQTYSDASDHIKAHH